jgi:hypothetical protein
VHATSAGFDDEHRCKATIATGAALMAGQEILVLLCAVVAAVMIVVVLRARQRSHAQETDSLADQVICEHLDPAWSLLQSRGHRAIRVGQKHPDLPMEIHISPPFDPRAIFTELELDEPVFVSDRNVLYCKEDWCELHPAG